MFLNPRILLGGTMMYAGGYLAAMHEAGPTWYNYAGIALAGVGWCVLGLFREDRH